MNDKINTDMQAADNAAFMLLSQKGKDIFFPYGGILGQTAEAKGKKINATIGTAFEDDGTALTLECLEGMISLDPSSFLYAPSFGLPDLRKKWREMLFAKNPGLTGKTVSLPVVTAALTHGLSMAGYLLVDSGDEIILPDLFWGNYKLIFANAYGAKLTTFPMFAGSGFNVDGLAEQLNADGDKKTVLLNFPNNPTGYTATPAEMDKICTVLADAANAGKKITVLVDDAYFGLVYEDGVATESLFAKLADLHKNVLAVKLDGPTKEDYVWGFRVGFITFGIKNGTPEMYAALEDKAAGAVRGNSSNCSSIGQQLLLAAYKHPDYDKQKQAKYGTLRARYDKVKRILADNPAYGESFVPVPFNSGYFMCVKLNGADPEAVRQELLASFDTGVIVQSGVVRLAFSAVPINQLETLFANLDAAVRKVKAG